MSDIPASISMELNTIGSKLAYSLDCESIGSGVNNRFLKWRTHKILRIAYQQCYGDGIGYAEIAL